MAAFELNCNLSSSLFPFASDMWGRSVIVPQYDMNYNRTVFSSIDPGFEKQTPQVFYMHNVMPTVQGYQSVGYDTVIDVYPNAVASGAFGSFVFGAGAFGAADITSVIYDRAYTIQTASQNNFIFVPAGGLNLIYDAAVGHWASVSPFSLGDVASNVQVTTAFVNGETYICYANKGVYIYDDTTKTLVAQVAVGLDFTQVIAICAANGYLIAVTKLAIAWSSTTNPLDFVPSLTTGAGGGSVQDAKGRLVSVAKINGGIIVYCEFNAVGGTYSGNIQFPYIFLEVPGSGGLSLMETLTWASNNASHFLWGTFGLQELTKTTVKDVYPELTDFLAAKIFEDFDETSLLLTTTYPTSQLSVKLSLIQSRYLVASYGISSSLYTHALVYDTSLKRWGKLKIDHSDCFEWNNPNAYGTLTYDQLAGTTYDDLTTTTYSQLDTQIDSVIQPKKGIAFLQPDGTVKLVNFDFNEATANGVFILGKFQFRRGQFITHQQGTVDVVGITDTFSYYVLPSYDGKVFQTPITALKNPKLSRGKSRTYQRVVKAMTVSILFLGKFNLSSYLFSCTSGGLR